MLSVKSYSGVKSTSTNIFKAYIELIRLHNVVATLLMVFIGYAVSARFYGLNPIPPTSEYYIAAVVVALVAAGGYVINDYFDVDIDSINKPWRPLPSGRVSLKTAYYMSVILFGTGIVVGFIFAGFISGIYALSASILLYYYSKSLKRRGLVGNLVVSFNSGSSILYGGIVFAERNNLFLSILPVFIPFLYAFLLVFGREIVKGIEDYWGDKAGGARTLAVIYGPKRAFVFAALVLFTVIVLSPLPYFIGVCNYIYLFLALIVDAIIIVSIVFMLKRREVDRLVAASATARTLLKWAFFFGGLAFALGALGV